MNVEIIAINQVRNAIDLLRRQRFSERDMAIIAGHALANLETVAKTIRQLAPVVRQPRGVFDDAEGRN